MTVLIIMITLIYAGIKLIELVQNTNPNISDVIVPEYISNTEYVSAEEVGFRQCMILATSS